MSVPNHSEQSVENTLHAQKKDIQMNSTRPIEDQPQKAASERAADPDLIIIGAGLAGLTAAYRLSADGFNCHILEKSGQLGGAMRSVEKNDYLLETGPNTIMETSPQLTALIRELGLEEDRIYADSSSAVRYVVRNRTMHALPSGPWAFLKSPLFSRKTLWHLLKEPFLPAWDNRREESLADFVLRRLNREFLDYAINPFVAGVFAGKPEEISVKHGFKRLYELEQNYGSMIGGALKGARERRKRAEKSKQNARMFSFRKGLSQLTETLAERSGQKISLNSEVTRILRSGDRWELKCKDGSVLKAPRLLFSGNTHTLTSIESDLLSAQQVRILDGIPHPPVAVLHLVFPRNAVKHDLKAFGVLIPEKEAFNILGALFNSSLFPGRAPEDRVLMTVFIGGSRQPEKIRLSDEELLKEALGDLNSLLGISSDPLYAGVVRWQTAIPQYAVGYGSVKAVFDDLRKQNEGLYFAGNYMNGISAADTVLQALHEADRILADKKGKGPAEHK